jgi:response regulator of citrate/malate metabolism
MVMRFKGEILQKIREVLKNKGEATVTQLAREVNVSRVTIYRYLIYLIKNNEIEEKEIGNITIFRLKQSLGGVK